MLKRFTLLASSLLAAFSIAAQETTSTASASFYTDNEGKTLVVSGKGDLTKLEINTYETKFTATAVGAVFVNTGESYASVNAGDAFHDNTSYYYLVVGEKTAIENTPEKPFLSNTTYVTSFSTDKYLKSEYVGKVFTSATAHSAAVDWLQNGTLVAADDKIITDGNVYYYIIDENGKYEVMVKSIDNTIEKRKANAISDMNGYCSEATMFTAAQTIYVSTDGGSSYTEIAEGTSAIYNESATYYTAGSISYELYTAENLTESFTASNYIEKSITETKSFSETLYDKIIENTTLSDNIYTGSYETVVFKNAGETDLLINDAIVRAILFPGDNGKFNGSIVTLDLGETTVNALGASTFQTAANQYYSCRAQHIIIPKTVKTSVLNEATNEYVEKMVVPTQLFVNYGTAEYLKEITIPEGYDRLAEKAFYNNAKITTFNLPSSLKLIGESAFELCGALTSITLNEGLENIGKRAFVSTNLTKISFPHSLRIINDAAFADLRIEELKFNAGLKYIGNTAFGLTSKMTVETIEIPASVKYIGPFAFNFREYQDVFFLGADAPIMPIGNSTYQTGDAWKNGTAFSAHTLMGNNGFKPTDQTQNGNGIKDDVNSGYANRENYKNNGYYFAILHFPTALDSVQRAKYTDITRVYKTHRDKDGKFYPSRSEKEDSYDEVGSEKTELSFGGYKASTKVCYGYEDTYLGSQYIWPSQEQWNRSYVVNSLGYNWDGVTEYRPTLSDEDKEVLEYAGYKIGTGAGEYTEAELQKIAHMGTRQFVLTNADTKKDEKPEEEPAYPISMKGSNWWTICVPFNMTKAQVDKVFGEGTHVCRFSSVTRTDDGKGNKSITLRFQNDVYATKWTRNPETLAYNIVGGSPADNDIVIYSHEAYMIYPTNSDEDANNMYNIKDYKLETGSPLPTIIKANADDETVGADHTEYRFVGNYVTEVSTGTATNADTEAAPAKFQTVTIPQYSYVYAKNASETNGSYKFWFYTGTKSAWAANKCVVQATARDRGFTDYKDFFGGNANNTKVTQMSLFGEDTDGGTTGINEEITIIAGEGDNAQRVYNLNGQMIGGNNATPKGIYIKGGKKYIGK